jgi:membrane protein DedA with SNARE-associated domain
LSNLIDFIHNLFVSIQSGQLPELGSWTYLLLAVLVAVEGPVTTLLAASAASAGLLRPLFVFFAAATGNLSADLLWYSLGYFGKIEWLFRFGKRLGIRPDLLEKMSQNIREHAVKVLFLAKLTVSLVIPSLITAGLMRIPVRRWFPAFISAETLWTGSLVLIGFYTTEALKRVERGIEYAVLFVTLLFVLSLIIIGRRLVKEWNLEKGQAVSDKN